MFPKASVNFLELLPRSSEDFNISMKTMNVELQKVCHEYQCSFVDTGSIFMNSNNTIKDQLYHGSTHLNALGSAKLATLFKSVFQLPRYDRTNFMNKARDNSIIKPAQQSNPFFSFPPPVYQNMGYPPPTAYQPGAFPPLPNFPFPFHLTPPNSTKKRL
ncbi:hypothetical protein SNE40_021103 [Patella caerulea]|uniref:Uncharacterized protein n=1 Tax=Patella caerulea TaxID=87958 RepID=A0AAN8G9B6_PATCE